MTVSKILKCPDALGLVFECLPATQAWRARGTSQLFQSVFNALQQQRTAKGEPIPRFYSYNERFELAKVRKEIAILTATIENVPITPSIDELKMRERLRELDCTESSLIRAICNNTGFCREQTLERQEEAHFSFDQKVYSLFGGRNALKNLPQLTEEQCALDFYALLRSVHKSSVISRVIVNALKNKFLIISNSDSKVDSYKENGEIQHIPLTVFTLIFKIRRGSGWSVISSVGDQRSVSLSDEEITNLSEIIKNSPEFIKNSFFIKHKKEEEELERVKTLRDSFEAQLDSLFGVSFQSFLPTLPEVFLENRPGTKELDLELSHLRIVSCMMSVKNFFPPNFFICNEKGEKQFFVAAKLECLSWGRTGCPKKSFCWVSFGSPIIPQGTYLPNESVQMKKNVYVFASQGKFANPESFAALQAWITAHKPQIENREGMPNPYFKGGE